MKNQDEIMYEILYLNRQIEERQEQINNLVLLNRKKIKEDEDFEEDYTSSIESYYMSSF